MLLLKLLKVYCHSSSVVVGARAPLIKHLKSGLCRRVLWVGLWYVINIMVIISTEYVEDPTERRKSRNERKKTLCTKAHKLVRRCEGQKERFSFNTGMQTRKSGPIVPVTAYGTNIRQRVHCIQPQKGPRVDSLGKPYSIQNPTPTNTSAGDCNFVVCSDACGGPPCSSERDPGAQLGGSDCHLTNRGRFVNRCSC